MMLLVVDMKMHHPLVSIVIPTYNHAVFLKEALASVMVQTYQNWEAIVVNNYSDDNTVEVVNTFHDSRISLINFRNNGVIAASRNKGIQAAQGEYVAFLDSDDLWAPAKLQYCVEKLLSGFDLVCHGITVRWEGGKTTNIISYSDKLATFEALLYRGNSILTSATVVNRDILLQVNGFSENPEYVTVEDYDLWLRISKVTNKIGFLQKLLGVYRVHSNNASNAVLKHLEAECLLLAAYFKNEEKKGLLFTIRKRKRYAFAYYSAGERFKATGNSFKSLAYYFKSFRLDPLLFEIYIGCFFMMSEMLKRTLKK